MGELVYFLWIEKGGDTYQPLSSPLPSDWDNVNKGQTKCTRELVYFLWEEKGLCLVLFLQTGTM